MMKMNPMIEKKEEEDPDTLAMCERRIREITGKGGIPLLAKCVDALVCFMCGTYIRSP